MKGRGPLWATALLAASIASISGADPAPARRSLRVAVSGATAPFDMELLTVFAKILGHEAVASATGPELAKGADVAAGVLAGEARIGDRSVTSEVLPTRLVAVTRRPATRVAAIESLRWSRVGVLRGSRAPTAMQDAKISGAEPVELNGLDRALAALRAGSVASLLLELPEALVALQRDPALALGVFVGSRRSYVFTTRRDDARLLADLDGYLRTLRSNPSWAALVARHFGPSSLDALARAHLTD